MAITTREATAVASDKTVITMKGSGSTYEELGDITSITPPGFDYTTIDVTHMQSPGSGRETRAGRKNTTTVTVSLNYAPGSATDARLREAGGKVKEFKIEFGNADASCSFSALVKSFAPADANVDGVFSGTLSLELQGEADWTGGA